MHPYMCEAGTKKIKQAISTSYKNLNWAYALTEDNQIIIFEAKVSGAKPENTECRVAGILSLPSKIGAKEQVDLTQNVVMESVKGALMIQAASGHVMVIDTLQATMQSNPNIFYFDPSFIQDQNSNIADDS